MALMSNEKLCIVIPGGSGHVGNVLARHFHEQGHSVTGLSRHPNQRRGKYCRGVELAGEPGHVLLTVPILSLILPGAA